MNFDFDDDQHEIKRTARELLAKRSGPREVREAAERGSYDPALWDELAALGWAGIAIPDEHGGGGLGVVELAILLEESGYALAGAPLLGSACAALVIDAAGSDDQRAEWLPRLATGAAIGALGSLRGGRAANVPDAEDADVIVLVDEAGGARLLARADADVEPVRTIDPTRRYANVTCAGRPLAGDVATGVDRAVVAVSAELVGISQRALEIAVEHAKERHQFDRPIGAFQAVSHRCAEMLLATESARSATYYAAWTADADLARLPEAACMAKIAASDAGRETTAAGIQVLGGIGFTWEADVHWLYKRAQLDAQMLGGATRHRARLAALLRNVHSPNRPARSRPERSP